MCYYNTSIFGILVCGVIIVVVSVCGIGYSVHCFTHLTGE